MILMICIFLIDIVIAFFKFLFTFCLNLTILPFRLFAFFLDLMLLPFRLLGALIPGKRSM